MVYIQTWVFPDAPDRSSLKRSPSNPGSMRPAMEESSRRVVAAVSRKYPWFRLGV